MSNASRPGSDLASTGAVGGGWRRRTFAALSVHDFRWYFAGNLMFFAAMQMNMVLRGYLAYDLTNVAIAIGLLAVSFALPMLFGAPIGGVIADRVNKRTFLLLLQSAYMVVELTITTLVLIGAIEFWHLLVTSFVGAIIQSAVMPTRQAVVPLLVPQHLVMNAVSLQMGTMNLTRIFGPAIGGILIGPFGIGTAYAVCTGFFLMSVITTLPLPKHGMRQDRKGRRGSFADDLLGGMRFVWQRPLFRMLIAVALLMPLFAFPLQHLLPVFQADVFERGPWALGVLMAATGVGGLAGTLFSASSDHLPRKGLLMFAGGVAMTAGYIAFALTPSFWVALVILALASVGRMLIQVMNHTVVQVLVPDEYRGRVMSLLMMSIGTAPLGILPVALAVDTFGARAAIAVHASLGLLVVFALFGLSSRLRGLNISALAQTELSPAHAAKLVADGSITQEEADRLTGRSADRGAVELEEVEGAPAAPASARSRSGAPAPVDGGS